MTPREQMEQAIGYIEAAFDTNEEFRLSAVKEWDKARQRIEELEGELEASQAENKRLQGNMAYSGHWRIERAIIVRENIALKGKLKGIEALMAPIPPIGI